MFVIKGDVFICVCLNVNDLLKDMCMVLNDCKVMGVEFVFNIGFFISYVDKDSEIFCVLIKSGIMLDNEIEFLKLVKEMDMVLIGLVFNMEDSFCIMEEV